VELEDRLTTTLVGRLLLVRACNAVGDTQQAAGARVAEGDDAAVVANRGTVSANVLVGFESVVGIEDDLGMGKYTSTGRSRDQMGPTAMASEMLAFTATPIHVFIGCGGIPLLG
jgi:hypothetical protein